MNQVATGITIERNVLGVPSYVRIDIRKSGNQLKDFFSSNGVAISDIPNSDTQKAMSEAQKNTTVGFDSIDALLYDLKN
ncbi:hypothetical protein AGMMS49965_05720 [Bacteroidia bacterium]|nr:hypothetical protein AGMMS49965_05720 [Bacteroidia bacterium]